jgi:hypothetical protein
MDDKVTVASGQKHRIIRSKVVFDTFILREADKYTLNRVDWQGTNPYISDEKTDKETILGGVDIEDKYVYVFRSVPEISEGTFELFLSFEGNKKDGYEVIVEDIEKREDGTYLQGNLKKAPVRYPVSIQGKPIRLLVCISQISLSDNRISQIEKNPCLRCVEIPYSRLTDKTFVWDQGALFQEQASDGKKIFVFEAYDYIAQAKKRNKEYQDALRKYWELYYDLSLQEVVTESQTKEGNKESHIEISDDESKKSRRLKKYTAGIVMNLITGDPSLKKYLAENGEKLYNDLEEMKKEEQEAYKLAAERHEGLLSILNTDYFREVKNDYVAPDSEPADREKLEDDIGAILENISAFAKGRKHIVQTVRSNDPVIGKIGQFFNEKLGTVTSVVQNTSLILAEICLSIKDEKSSEAYVNEVKNIFWNRLGLRVKTVEENIFKRKGLTTFPGLKSNFKIKKIRLIPTTQTEARWNNVRKNIEEFNNKLNLILDSVAFCRNISEIIYEHKEANVSDIVKEASFVLYDSIALLKSNNEFSKLASKIEFAKKINPVFMVISSSIEMYSSFEEASKKVERGDSDAALFKDIQGYGAACVAISGVMELIAIGASATGVGLPVGSVLFIVGTALGIAGNIGFTLTNDPPIVEFIKNTSWGSNGKYFENLKYEYLNEELKTILPIINGFQASCRIEVEGKTSLFRMLIIDVYPRLYTESSKVSIFHQQFTFSSETSLEEIEKPIELDNSNAEVINEKERTIIRYKRSIPSGATSFSAHVKMDVYGDGSFMLPSYKDFIKIQCANLGTLPGTSNDNLFSWLK